MKTMRFFLFSLALAGILTACSKDESVELLKDEQAISFRLQGSTPSTILRATATTTGNVDAFVVWGTDNVFGAVPGLIFDGITVARKVSSNDFEYSPLKYYGEGATNAGFFAISPVSAKVTIPAITNFMTNGASFDYTVPAPDGSGDAIQEDLLVAGAVLNPSVNPAVSLQFKHALSRIFVTATNDAADPVIIESLSLVNVIKTGTLEVNTDCTWDWVPDEGKIGNYPYTLAQTGVAVPQTSTAKLVTSMEQGMLILPQKIVNNDVNDFALKVVYSFANLEHQEKYILIDDGFKFLFNTQYRINIHFGVGAIIGFTIDVLPFEDYIDD